MKLEEAEFIQQYLLKRAGALDATPSISGIIEDGKRAFRLIESKCVDVDNNNTNKQD